MLLCRTCRSWDVERLAYPELGERAGSMRICDKGRETHAGSWKPCWMPRTPEQLAQEANDEGRLF